MKGIILKKLTTLMNDIVNFYDISSLYGEAFPKLEIEIKEQNLITPWITNLILIKVLIRFFKRRQKRYNKFLKSRKKNLTKL